MSYNFLRRARSIKNSMLCKHDTLNAYQTNLDTNGDFDGWDVYNNIYLYGSWNGTLFGTSYGRECYIGRSVGIIPVAAETYYIVKVMMKITDNNNKAVGGLTTGKIRWVTLNDGSWNSDKEEEFDLINDDEWHLYQINMGPVKDWQGDISNLRVYPFTDGWEKDQFAIKFIRISSIDTFICDNTQCSYYTRFEHNCPGAGVRGSIEAGVSKQLYSTISGVSDKLIVNINGYGDEEFELGTNTNLNGIEMARVIGNALGMLNVGGYVFSEVEYSELDKIKITSGSPGTHTSVSIPYSLAAEELGFYNSGQVDISAYESGVNPATGFDFAASRRFKAFEINKMIDGNQDQFAYEHNPDQFSVEGGRSDFSEIGNSRLISDLNSNEYFESLNNTNRTIIDASHPINNNGRIKAIYIFGKIRDDTQGKIKICRPKKDGTMEVIHSFTFDSKINNVLYTKRPLTSKIDVDVLVEKGDLIGVYNANLYVGVSITGLPDASFYQYSGEVSGTFDPGRLYSFGVAGLAVYARGERKQNNVILDIDMGDRVNIEQVDIYGLEESEYFEFNLASCLDVTWDVNLYGESHFHSGYNMWTGQPFYDVHTNLYYGKETLEDMVTTPDGGQCGDSWGYNNGLATYGTHTYFYVNGDAEWLYSGDPNEIAEYHWPYEIRVTGGFTKDPISFTMLFPNESDANIHKSIIYFKEDDNFRNLELSYYLGSKNGTGNAYRDNFFKRIPSYTSIKLDGMVYDSTNNESVEEYLFNNPMSDEATYAGGVVSNASAVKAAHRTYWNIIEHNFNDIECKGFRIYTNKHNSTKIMEIELYSRVRTDPALLDNITMSFSDYGETWIDVSFEEPEEGRVSSFIGGSPRYFRLEFESTNKFDINEIHFSVGDQLKLSDCEDVVLLEESKIGAVNEATSVDIKNIYDRPFDLIIDLPKETDENNGLIFWSKMNSEDDVENPDIGPACFLRKEDDYDILNDNKQCAINVPAYGLKNLVEGKTAYYSQDSMGHWQSFGTLSSGVSLDFCTNNYRKTEFTFNPVAASHWKIGFPSIVPASPAVDIKYIDAYYNDTLVPLETVYFTSSRGSSAQSGGIVSDGVDMSPAPEISDSNDAFGLRFSSITIINKIRIIHDSSSFFDTADVYINYVNDNHYMLWDNESGTLNMIHGNDTYNTYFAIDMGKRYKLDIIRNYGSATNKLLLGSNVDHSNTDVSSPDSVVWDNSDIDDTRWVRVNLLTGDGTTRCLRKLGIYPDISQNAAPGGGYNCEWQSMGNILSDYNISTNVAYGATVTGTNNYFANWYPTNAVDGVHDEYFEEQCWGFQKEGGVDPYIEIDFGQVYTIEKVVLAHGYNPGDSTYMNNDYNISVSDSVSGSFTQVLSVTGNSSFSRTHYFDPVEARRLRLTITDYDYGSLVVQDLDGDYNVFRGSFLREIEVYTDPEIRYVNSEDWPVMIQHLNEPFLVTNHDISNIGTAPTGTDWDNDEQFFRYSDDLFDDPQKVTFYTGGQYVIVYYKNDTSGDAAGQQIYWQGNTEYIFDQNVFLSEGTYRVNYDAYDADTADEISLRFEGPQTVDVFAVNTGSNSWKSQDEMVQIPEDGFYDIKGVQHLDFQDIWGVRNPLVRIVQGETTWVSITRDTATNYSYDDDSGKYGIDTIDKLKIYGDRKYRPTEYSWWWSSQLSTLSNNAIYTKVGSRSLQIDYPVSSGTDTISFREGDDFGQDSYWSPKDVLRFWWRIDDVSKLDTTIGDITFGSINRGNPFYYVWDIENMSLSNGWNLMKLKFDEYDHIFPEVDEYAINQFLDDDLDLRINGKDLKSFRLRFRGVGQSLTMHIDAIHIERNKFEDDVQFGKGLCLVGREMLEIPVSGLTLEKGAIEFWLKTYYDSYGRDAFGNMASKTLFTLTNNNNDIISLGLRAGSWFESTNGNIRSDLNKFETEFANLIEENFVELGGIVHLALAWSNDSEYFDNDDSIRLYLNGEAVYSSEVKWTVKDTKSVNIKFGGASTQLAFNRESYGAGVFDNIKIYNYTKTDFNPYRQGIDKDITYTPNEFLEVSPDNVNFYGIGSANLPIIFEQVPVNETKTIYLRSNKNDNILQSRKTASLVIQWLTTV